MGTKITQDLLDEHNESDIGEGFGPIASVEECRWRGLTAEDLTFRIEHNERIRHDKR